MLHGVFFGFKLHLIYNKRGELLNFIIRPVTLTTASLWSMTSSPEFIYGKFVGDKGYIGGKLFKKLFVDGIQLITKLKSNMKGGLMSIYDRLLIRKEQL